MPYDEKCHELAQYFLAAIPEATSVESTTLAEHIQRTIEDWLEYEMPRPTGDKPVNQNYDDWKQTDPRDRRPEGEREDGCTCSGELGAGGALKTDEWCPIHGRDPDAERERERDD